VGQQERGCAVTYKMVVESRRAALDAEAPAEGTFLEGTQ
jgi:hypothetical protein